MDGLRRFVGSTLALAYAETHAERVSSLVLRGIFLCRPKEIEWFYQEGANAIFPDAWEQYERVIPESERGNMLEAYYRRLTSDDESVRLEAARAWSVWEGSALKLIPDQKLIDDFTEPHKALSLARIEAHYHEQCVFRDRQLPARKCRQDSPHSRRDRSGRYDIVCPMMSAWELHRAWPEAEFIVVGDAGHSVTEPGITDALVDATDRFRIQMT